MSTKVGFTPGPWRVQDDFNAAKIIAPSAEPSNTTEPREGEVEVAHLICHAWRRNPFADARLIAAAPDLLRACEAIREGAFIPQEVRLMLDAAISKARGEA